MFRLLRWKTFFGINVPPRPVFSSAGGRGKKINFSRPRAPLWDELKYEGSSVRYDDATDSYVYSFTLDSHTIPATLTIPAKFFTPDMLVAPNRTLKD